MSLMNSCQSWEGEETAGPGEREGNLLQTKQCVSSAALAVPAWFWSQSGGTRLQWITGLLQKHVTPSRNYSLQWVRTTGFLLLSRRRWSTGSISALSLYSNVVPQLYIDCICVWPQGPFSGCSGVFSCITWSSSAGGVCTVVMQCSKCNFYFKSCD